MAKKVKKVKQPKKVKLPPAAESKDHDVKRFSAHHYSISIEAAIDDRTRSMDKLSRKVASFRKRTTRSGNLLRDIVAQLRTLFAAGLVSIDMYVDDDDLHVENARVEIGCSLSELERLSRPDKNVRKAIRKELKKIATVIEAERDRYASAPSPGVYDDYE